VQPVTIITTVLPDSRLDLNGRVRPGTNPKTLEAQLQVELHQRLASHVAVGIVRQCTTLRRCRDLSLASFSEVGSFRGGRYERQYFWRFTAMTVSSFSLGRVVSVALMVLATLPIAAATTIHVPADKPTIQAAIDAAVNGDTVLVADGTYTENIDFKGKAITVRSTNGATKTTINGGKVDAVAKFVTAEGLSSVLDGFTITNGNGLGINILSTSPTVKNNIVTLNTGCPGIGILIGDGSPLIQNNTVSNNAQLTCFGGDSAGITVGGPPSGAQIIGNTISGNNSSLGTGGGGISLNAVGSVLIQGNLIQENAGFRGGGIGGLNDTSQVRIIENVISGNTGATAGGMGIDNTVSLILNNTVAGNDAPGGASAFSGHFFTTTGAMTISNNLFIGNPGQPAVDCRGFDTVSPPVFSFNDVFTPGGPNYGSMCIDQTGKNGNISVDPLFVNSAASDFRLQATSPAIDGGSNTAPSLPTEDIAGNDRILDGNGDCLATVDMGAYEFARPSVLTLSPNNLAFPDQVVGSTSAPLPSAITNTASTAMTVCGFVITGDFSQTNTCGSSIASKGTCAVNVDFTPTAHGPRSGFLQLITNDAGSPQSITLSGKGVLPIVALSTSALTFAAQQVATKSASQSIALNNTGDGTLTITSVAITGDFSQSNNCGNTVAPAANCTFSITFAPSTSGNRTGSLTITDNASGSPHAVALTGAATDFSLGAATGGSTTASVMAGNTATYSLQVSALNGFAGTVALSCTGAPSLATCTVAPTSVTLNGALSSAFTVTVTTTAPSMMAPRKVPPSWPPVNLLRFGVPLLLALILFAMQARFRTAAERRKFGIAYALVLVSVLSIAACVSGCNGGGGQVHHPGTPPGTSTITITGSSGGVSRTQNLTLTVN
jgi:hypothetical protein